MPLIVVVQAVLGVVYGIGALVAAYFAGEAGGDVAGGIALGAVVLLAPGLSAAAFGRRVPWVWVVGTAVAAATLLAVAFME